MVNKNYISIAIAGVIIILVLAFVSTKKPDDLSQISPSPSPTPQASPAVSLNPTLIPAPKSQSAKPMPMPQTSPKTYEQLVEQMDEEGTHFKIDPKCNSIAPSNVAYWNNTRIMLDNTASKERHILKIGDREYLLEAGEWFLTTLSSTILPVTLPIYCGTLELGSIDLH